MLSSKNCDNEHDYHRLMCIRSCRRLYVKESCLVLHLCNIPCNKKSTALICTFSCVINVLFSFKKYHFVRTCDTKQIFCGSAKMILMCTLCVWAMQMYRSHVMLWEWQWLGKNFAYTISLLNTFIVWKLIHSLYVFVSFFAMKPFCYNQLACTYEVRPLVEFVIPVWTSHTKAEMDKLERFQRKAARFVCGDYKQISSVSAILYQLGWDSIQKRRKQAKAVRTYQYFSDSYPFQRSS